MKEVESSNLDYVFAILRSINTPSQIHLETAVKAEKYDLAFKMLDSDITFTSNELDTSIFQSHEDLI